MECKIDGCDQEAHFASLCRRHLAEHRKPLNLGQRAHVNRTLKVILRSSLIKQSIGESNYEHILDEILQGVERVVADYIVQEIEERKLVSRGIVDPHGHTWEVISH